MILTRILLILLSGLTHSFCLAADDLSTTIADATRSTSMMIANTVETSSSSSERTYSRDLSALQEALSIAGFARDIPEEFADPNHGELSFMMNSRQAPWAGNYFPMAKGGLANRWQTRETVDIEKLPNAQAVKNLTQEQINRLSPIEKYDLYRGDYTFMATRHELTKRGPLRAWPVADWEGFCNGVRCAGIHLPEPKHAISVESRDGILVTFQPADLKALAGASYFFVEKYSQMGSPSQQEARAQNQPNAAVFDMTLRYYVAEKKAAFIIDSHLGSEIWNETVIGYNRTLSQEEPLSNEEKQSFPLAVSKKTVRLDLYSLADISIRESNQSTKDGVAAGNYHKTTKAEYTLYLDAQNKAFDGVWKKTKSLRGIDFVWFSGGRGTDSKNPKGNGNEQLSFKTVERLVRMSHRPLSCQKILSL